MMKRVSLRRWLKLFVASVALAGCTPEEPFPNLEEKEKLDSLWGLPERPPADPTNRYQADPRAQALGQRFFNDPGFSRCGDISCQSCHQGPGLTFEEASAVGCDGQRTGRNAPSLLNVAHGVWFMWDGRADRLWSQALLPLTSPVEMASNVQIVRARVAEKYAADYQALFGAPVTAEGDDRLLANFGKAIAAYEATLHKSDSRFDGDLRRFLAAASRGQAEEDPLFLGLKTFVRKGRCIDCHKSNTLSDDKFHNVGVADATEGAPGRLSGIDTVLSSRFRADGELSDDRGSFATQLQTLEVERVEKRGELEGAFKTPTLRNLTLTAPYMHTGELKTLEEVVDLYDQGGEPSGSYAGHTSESIGKLELTDAEKKALLELLRSLSPE